MTVDERRRREIARRRDVEVLAEIMADAVLGRIVVPRLHPAVAAVDAPQIDRDALAEMAEHDLELRAFVEQARADQPQRVHRGLGVERPVRPEQPVMAFVHFRPARQRVARVQIERHVERLDRAPERPVLRQVVIEHGVRRAGLGKAVDQRADKAELLDAARQFRGSGLRVLHRQRGKGGKAAGALGALVGEHVVGLARHRDGALDVVDRLDRRRVERQDHHFDAVFVHLGKAHVLDVDEPRPELLPDVRAEHLGVAERCLDGEVLLERDLALHCVCSPDFRGIMQWRRRNAKAAWAGGCIGVALEGAVGLPTVAREASEGWWSQAGSNRRPPACHAGALPAELWPLKGNR